MPSTLELKIKSFVEGLEDIANLASELKEVGTSAKMLVPTRLKASKVFQLYEMKSMRIRL